MGMAQRWTIIEFPELVSSNTYLKEHSEAFGHLTVIRTDYQTHGRGQFNRTWESERGKNLLCSILFKESFNFPPEWMNPIVIAALLALLTDYGINAYYKAPNDIYVGHQKIAGILMESKYEQKSLQAFILGIGLNVNQRSFPSSFQATSMASLTGKTFSVPEVLQRLLDHLERFLKVGELIFAMSQS